MTDSPRADRIRDNQRRSRERKKQRTEELEARVREFEKLGVDATQAMQAAARRVDEDNRRLRVENGKLRALLRKHGYVDAAIDACLDVEPDPPAVHRMTPAVQALETMFSTRRFPLPAASSSLSLLSSPSLSNNVGTTTAVDHHHHHHHHHNSEDEPHMITSPVALSPLSGGACQARRALSQDYSTPYHQMSGLSGAQTAGFDAVNAMFAAEGMAWRSGGEAQDQQQQQPQQDQQQDYQQQYHNRDARFNETQDGQMRVAAEMLMSGRHCGSAPDPRYAVWTGEPRQRQ